ncbi:hypothetical protein [Halorussus salinisoli]|uniref:hypothetical protein n=1 Tax=Halorussus salinisoli TaxID=2558242 RepID=UPI002A90F1A4|nr:hypothetical protein [Halorussus salinisoli]
MDTWLPLREESSLEMPTFRVRESAREFKRQWESHALDPRLSDLFAQLTYVEQPLARDNAFTEETRDVLESWDDAPPFIIDESDGRIDSAKTALEYGYEGTSHKNCKGIFKGIANACLIAHRNRTEGDREYVLTAVASNCSSRTDCETNSEVRPHIATCRY